MEVPPAMSFLLHVVLLCSTYGITTSKNITLENPSDRFNEFDWHLSKAIGSSVKTNVLISPISVKLVLAMLYEGASGTTAKELEEVLKIEKGPAPSQRFSNIMQSLQASNEGYELDVGMKVFIDKEAVPKKSFEKKIFNLYNATIDTINFKNTSAAVAHINSWAKSVTKGHIKQLLTEADTHHSTLMLLLNAVYFKGLWQFPFKSNATKEGIFMTDQNTPVQVEYMNGIQTLSYYDSLELKSSIVKLPYEGNKFAMYIILPDKGTTLDEVIEILTPTKVRSNLINMLEVPVNINLPKFKFEYASSLAPVLKELGLREIFSNQADLHNIAEGPTDPVVSNVIQKAAIEINEQGTVASVVTAIELVNKFGMHTVSLNISRPFLFFIEDETTNTVIFLGKVVNPVALGKPIVSAASPESVPPPPSIAQKIPSSLPTNAPTTTSKNVTVLSAPALTQKVPVQADQQLHPFYYLDIDLIKSLNQIDKGNWIISPASIKTSLAIILEGASKTTAFEICQILRLPLDINEARSKMHRIQKNLASPPPQVTLKSGSILLAKYGLGINNKFRNAVSSYYSAPIKVSNFTQPVFLAYEVNKWVKEVTSGSIPDILTADAITPDAILLLANAVFFKGDWKVQFNPVASHSGCFYVPQCKKVPLMGTSGAFKVGEMRNLNARVLELPYENPRYSMVILLPHEKTGLQRTASNLPFNSITTFLDSLLPVEVDIVIPKFSIDYSLELKPILEQLGLREVFSDKAEFLELFHPGTGAKLSSFIHRAKIEVNEKGTVAAGTTVAQFQLLSTNNKQQFIADRPFFFFVRDSEVGFLFEGQLSDPLPFQNQENPLVVREVTEHSSLKNKETTTFSPTKKVESKKGSVFTHSYSPYDKDLRH